MALSSAGSDVPPAVLRLCFRTSACVSDRLRCGITNPLSRCPARLRSFPSSPGARGQAEWERVKTFEMLRNTRLPFQTAETLVQPEREEPYLHIWVLKLVMDIINDILQCS